MENSLIILQKLVVLFCFIFVGYYAFKRSWVTKDGSAQVSRLVVNVFNPALVLATAVCNTKRPSVEFLVQNIILMLIFYLGLILVSPIVARILRVEKQNYDIFTIMMTFANTGFMGIPLVASIYGQNSTIYVSFYVLGFNFLFYTYALFLFRKKAGDSSRFSIKDLINPGTVTGLLAILALIFPISYPVIVTDILSSASDFCIALAMLVTGFSLAQVEFSKIFSDLKLYAFTIIRMIIIPMLAVVAFRILPVNMVHTSLAGIMVIMFTMPNGSLPVIACQDYGVDGDLCSRAYALTTLLSIVTIPIITIML